MEHDYDHRFKAILIGDSGVGKSNLLRQWRDSQFVPEHTPTIGTEFSRKPLGHNEKIRLEIWDTPGQARYKGLVQAYMRSTKVFIFVFDLTAPESFAHIQAWLDVAKGELSSDTVKILLGNKSDLVEQGHGLARDAQHFAQTHQMTYQEISATSTDQVHAFFQQVAKQALETHQQHALETGKLPPHEQLNNIILSLFQNVNLDTLKRLNNAFASIYKAAQQRQGKYLGSKLWKQTWDYARTHVLESIYQEENLSNQLALIKFAQTMDFFKLHVNTSAPRTRGTPTAIKKLQTWEIEHASQNKIISKFNPRGHARHDTKHHFTAPQTRY